MNDLTIPALSWLAGLAIGAFFFGGLWWTVRKGLSSPNPALWFIGSMLLRTSIAIGGFFFVSGGQIQRLLLCLAGFLTARVAVTRLTRPADIHTKLHPEEASHATQPR